MIVDYHPRTRGLEVDEITKAGKELDTTLTKPEGFDAGKMRE